MSVYIRCLIAFWLTTLLTVLTGAYLVLHSHSLRIGQQLEVPYERISACTQSIVESQRVVQNAKERPTPGCSILFVSLSDGVQIYGTKPTQRTLDLLTALSHSPGSILVDGSPMGAVVAATAPTAMGSAHTVAWLASFAPDIRRIFWLHILVTAAISAVTFWGVGEVFDLSSLKAPARH